MLKTSASFVLLLSEFSLTINTVSIHFTRCENKVQLACRILFVFLLFAVVVAFFFFFNNFVCVDEGRLLAKALVLYPLQTPTGSLLALQPSLQK